MADFVEGMPLPESMAIGTPELELPLQKIQDQQRMELRADIQFLLNQAQGRRFLWRLLERANVYESNMRESHAQMAYEAGLKDMGVWVIGQLTAADEHAYAKLLVDQTQDRKLDKLVVQAQLERAKREGLTT